MGGKKCESRDEKKKRGWRLIERMKEERVNRKDGALEETDKDLREQMRGRKEMEMKIRAKKRKSNGGKRKDRGRAVERKTEIGRERESERERERHQVREGSFELQ